MPVKCFQFEKLITESKILAPAFVSVDSKGLITEVSETSPVEAAGTQVTIEKIDAIAIPGYQNAHSHAFQYAMAGLAEGITKGHEDDDFWGWRKTMYNLALKLNPDDIETIAVMLYSQMLAHGYTSVAEFHYLHHDSAGKHYANESEIGERLVSAAQTAGINITLVPVYYKTGDFSKTSSAEQRRFISNSPEQYLRLFESSKKSIKNYDGAKLGAGFHSLRSSPMEDIKSVLGAINDKMPIHIHIAEQQKEIDSCLSFCNKRPVEYLLDEVEVDENFHLVHSTHINEIEAKRIIEQKANVVICPTTEGNLGDGFFPLVDFLKNGGKISIGSDSHVSLNFLEELRLLDYGQRLLKQKRNVNCTLQTADESGDALYWPSTINGAKAMDASPATVFEIGTSFDAVLIDPNHHSFAASSEKNGSGEHGMSDHRFFSTLVFASNHKAQIGTICRGHLVVNNHIHENELNFSKNYKTTVTNILLK